ncbi:Gfo/Idh/MocA family protein [Jiangella gansuensis]|uniref:Gfo/Idh/MocA family protein n=1 Tax=Jiangella gansuensis TaxID=281473 RepID=UPI00146F9DE1|nr:Gfo/Idh/MocA family oxidoreductase [Jiangella gansuensis]
MTRIGVVGTENSHVDHFVRFLNVEHRHGAARVVALAGGDTERNRALATVGGIDTVVESAGDLTGLADAVIVSSRDGRTHRADAVPLLEAGIPVLVDKPLAASATDAEAIVAAARRGGVPLVSASALRFVPEMAALTAAPDRIGPLTSVQVTGPADPASPYAGLYFYGVHHAEAALQVIGEPGAAGAPGAADPPGPVHVQRAGIAVVATTTVADVHVVLTFVPAAESEAVPFHVTVVGTRGIETYPLTLGPDYNAPVLDRFLRAVEDGVSPVADNALLAPIVLLDAITARLDG